MKKKKKSLWWRSASATVVITLVSFMVDTLESAVQNDSKKPKTGMFADRQDWFGKYDEYLPTSVLPETACLGPGAPHHEIKLDSPDAKWINGLPLGNGNVMTMMYGSAYTLKFLFNKTDVWDERHRGPNNGAVLPESFAKFKDILRRDDKEAYEKLAMAFTGNEDRPSYQVCGELEIALEGGGTIKHDRRSLSLRNAEASISFQDEIVRYDLNAFFAAKPPVLTIQWQGELPPDKKLRIALFRHPSLLVGSPTVGTEDNLLWIDMSMPFGVRYIMMARVEGQNLKVCNEIKLIPPLPDRLGAAATTEDVGGTPSPIVQACATQDGGQQSSLTIYLTVVSTNDDPDPFTAAKRVLRKAHSSGHETIRRNHQQHWENFWRKSAVRLPEVQFEKHWYMGLYMLGSCSGIGATAPPAQAWTDTNIPVSTGRYHLDGDVMLYYWPTYTTNHLELGEPYYRLFIDALPQVKQDTKNYFGYRGARFPLAMSPSGKETGGHIQALWPGSSAWVALNFWWHYLYSKDLNFLRGAAYPFFKECILFYEDYLEQESAGRRRIFPDYSPEHLYWGANATVDISLLKSLYHAAIESSRILDIDVDERARWEDTLVNLPSYPQRDGHLIELETTSVNCCPPRRGYKIDDAGIECTEQHCVLSHLVPIYPALDLNLQNSPEDQAVARASLENAWQRRLGLPPEKSGPGVVLSIGFQYFTSNWLAAALSQFGQGDRSLECISAYLTGALMDNGLPATMGRDNIPYFYSIGLSLGFVGAVNEMLLQGHHGLIRVFPAIPESWNNVAFHSFRCEGPFLVSSEIKDDQVQYVLIQPLIDGVCRLHDPFLGDSVVVRQQGQAETLFILPASRKETEISFPTERDALYLIESAN